MKTLTLSLLMAAGLMVAACDDPAPQQPVPDAPVHIDDECPRADRTPCR